VSNIFEIVEGGNSGLVCGRSTIPEFGSRDHDKYSITKLISSSRFELHSPEYEARGYSLNHIVRGNKLILAIL
jgi:hypothetical protein